MFKNNVLDNKLKNKKLLSISKDNNLIDRNSTILEDCYETKSFDSHSNKCIEDKFPKSYYKQKINYYVKSYPSFNTNKTTKRNIDLEILIDENNKIYEKININDSTSKIKDIVYRLLSPQSKLIREKVLSKILNYKEYIIKNLKNKVNKSINRLNNNSKNKQKNKLEIFKNNCSNLSNEQCKLEFNSNNTVLKNYNPQLSKFNYTLENSNIKTSHNKYNTFNISLNKNNYKKSNNKKMFNCFSPDTNNIECFLINRNLENTSSLKKKSTIHKEEKLFDHIKNSFSNSYNKKLNLYDNKQKIQTSNIKNKRYNRYNFFKEIANENSNTKLNHSSNSILNNNLNTLKKSKEFCKISKDKITTNLSKQFLFRNSKSLEKFNTRNKYLNYVFKSNNNYSKIFKLKEFNKKNRNVINGNNIANSKIIGNLYTKNKKSTLENFNSINIENNTKSLFLTKPNFKKNIFKNLKISRINNNNNIEKIEEIYKRPCTTNETKNNLFLDDNDLFENNFLFTNNNNSTNTKIINKNKNFSKIDIYNNAKCMSKDYSKIKNVDNDILSNYKNNNNIFDSERNSACSKPKTTDKLKNSQISNTLNNIDTKDKYTNSIYSKIDKVNNKKKIITKYNNKENKQCINSSSNSTLCLKKNELLQTVNKTKDYYLKKCSQEKILRYKSKSSLENKKLLLNNVSNSSNKLKTSRTNYSKNSNLLKHKKIFNRKNILNDYSRYVPNFNVKYDYNSKDLNILSNIKNKSNKKIIKLIDKKCEYIFDIINNNCNSIQDVINLEENLISSNIKNNYVIPALINIFKNNFDFTLQNFTSIIKKDFQ